MKRKVDIFYKNSKNEHFYLFSSLQGNTRQALINFVYWYAKGGNLSYILHKMYPDFDINYVYTKYDKS